MMRRFHCQEEKMHGPSMFRNLFDKKYMSGIESMWGTPLGFAGQDRTWILSYIHKW